MLRFCSLLAVGWLLTAVAAGAEQPRYTAMLANGQRLQGKTLSDWHEPKAVPRLDGQPLLATSNPLRWLRNHAQRPGDMPNAYIETHTGDRFPGQVVDYRSGNDDPYDPLPPHLLVRPEFEPLPPQAPSRSEIRIALPYLRKIVWQRQSARSYRPAMAFYRDGREVEFRAIRFAAGHVHLLLADGNRKIDWSELAELHLAAPESIWQAYYQELAAVCSAPDVRLLQIETAAGLVATTSVERMKPRFNGNAKVSDGWVHGVQPAWSLDILWIPFPEIVCYRSFLPHEVPLSRLLPQRIEKKSSLGGLARTPQVNRNALGGELRTAQHDFGWGWGVQSHSELTFALPEGVKSFRSWVGLDRAAGKGGCVRARVFANAANSAPLWESPFIVGSQTFVDTGTLSLRGPAAGQKSLILQIDAAHAGRPRGADPLEIRDHADWLDPLLELDVAAVKKEFDRLLPERIVAWRGWEVKTIAESASEPQLAWSMVQDDGRPSPGAFHLTVATRSAALALSRELRITPSDRWLVFAATRPPGGGSEPKLEVRIDGVPVAEYAVPQRLKNRDDVRPLAISLDPYHKAQPATIQVEVRQLATANDAAPVEWRALQTVEQLPGLRRVFDEPADLALLQPGSLAGATFDDDRHYGQQSLRIAAGETAELKLREPIAIREQPTWGESRHLRFAFRKKGAGRVAVELQTDPPRDQPIRYDAGPGEPVLGKATRVTSDAPDQWVVVTRDVLADFGPIDVTDISFVCPDGEAVLVDHVYFGRNHQDLQLIPAAPSPEQTNEKARGALMQLAVERALPALVTIELADGRTIGGVCVRKEEGEILTAGHVLVRPQQEVVVHFADGKRAAGKTLGVCRDLNLGLIRLNEKGDWPILPTWDRQDLPQQDLYAALTFPASPEPGSKAEVRVAAVRRHFRNDIWVDADAPQWVPGGALVHRDGVLVGLHTGRSRFGGFTFTRLLTGELNAHLPRLRSGEVYGEWPVGVEPAD